MVASLSGLNRPLHGQRALVVGGEGGIGSVVSAGLAADGAHVAVAGLDQQAAAAVAKEIAELGATTTAHHIDITDEQSIDTVLEEITTTWGPLNVLVNCAGLLRVGRAEDLEAAAFRQVIDVNLTGAFLLSRAAGRRMIEAGTGGRIVHMSSVRATLGLAIGGFSAYGASKAGVQLLIRQLATEWGRHQISVNGVAAGFVDDGLSAQAQRSGNFPAMVRARTPLGRVAEVQEIANAVLYLAGPRASFVNGHVLVVDGGLSASQ